MRIGIFAARLEGNGPRTRTRRLIEGLAERTDHQPVVITSDPWADHRIQFHHIDLSASGLLAAAPTVRRAFRECDVVHVPINLKQALFVRALYRGPLVIGPGVKHDFRGRAIADALGADAVVDTHEYVAYLWEISGFDATASHPPVDRDRFCPDGPAMDLGEPAILFVGALTRHKGAHLVAELADIIDAAVVVCGDGPLRALFERRDSVRYEGFVDNRRLPRYYRGADVTVVPSRAESFCATALESVACGTPVVTTTQEGTMVRLFRERGTYVWADRSVAGLREAINDLLSDPERYQAQVEAGEAAIGDLGLTVGDAVDTHDTVYQEVAG